MSSSAAVLTFTGAQNLVGADPTRWLDDVLPNGRLTLPLPGTTGPGNPPLEMSPLEMSPHGMSPHGTSTVEGSTHEMSTARRVAPSGPPVALVSCVFDDLAVLVFQADEESARSAFSDFVLTHLPAGLQVAGQDDTGPQAHALPAPATGQVTFYQVERSFTNVAVHGESPVTKGQPCIVISK